MLQMGQHYETEFKKIVRIHLEAGRFLKNLAVEHGVSHASNPIEQVGSAMNARPKKKSKPITII